MKSFPEVILAVGLIIAAFVGGTVDAGQNNEMFETLQRYIQECKAQENAADGDIDSLSEYIMPDSKQGQCLVACVGEKLGVFDANNFSPERIVEITEKIYDENESGKETAVNVMQMVGEECRGVTHVDRCQLAVDVFTCFKTVVERERANNAQA